MKTIQLSAKEKGLTWLGDIWGPEGVSAFWIKAKTNASSHEECWLWPSLSSPGRYGSFAFNYRRYAAHKAALELSLGRPATGWCLHSCDTPACVNPRHLREGTPKDNTDDAMSRNRLPINKLALKGEEHRSAKLTETQVRAIRRLLDGGALLYDVAAAVGVSTSTVSKIKRKILWKDV